MADCYNIPDVIFIPHCRKRTFFAEHPDSSHEVEVKLQLKSRTRTLIKVGMPGNRRESSISFFMLQSVQAEKRREISGFKKLWL